MLSTRYRYIKGFLLLLILPFSACFRVGLPEYFSGNQNYNSPSGNRALIVLEDKDTIYFNSKAENSVNLGHQYLLAFFPLTSMFLPHGPDNLLLESFRTSLLEKNYDVFISDTKHLARAAKTIQPSIILSAQIENLSLSAYDAIFLRIIKVEGTIKLWQLSLNGLQKSALPVSTPTNKTLYKSKAHLPFLAMTLKSEIQNTLSKTLDKMFRFAPVRRKSRLKYSVDHKTDNNYPLIILNPPVIENPSYPYAGKLFADSYFLADVQAYTISDLSRLAQRGIFQEIRMQNLPVVDASFKVHSFSVQDSIWILDTKISKLRFSDDYHYLHYKIEFSISSLQENKGVSKIAGALFKTGCRVTIEQNRNREGFWLLHLEQSTAEATREFLTGRHFKKGKSQISCNNL